MGSGQSDVQEEGISVAGAVRIALDERFRLARERVEHLEILEVFGGRSDPVEGAPALPGRHLALEPPLLREHIRVHVQRPGQDERIVEPEVVGSDLQRQFVVHVLEALVFPVGGLHQGAEVPLAHVPGSVPGLLQQRADRERACPQLGVEEAPRPALARPGEAPCVSPRHDRDAGRHAYRCSCVGIREEHAAARQRIERWRGDLAAVPAVALGIADTEIVRHHVDDVGRGRRIGRAGCEQDQQDGDFSMHGTGLRACPD